MLALGFDHLEGHRPERVVTRFKHPFCLDVFGKVQQGLRGRLNHAITNFNGLSGIKMSGLLQAKSLVSG